jgi:predicted DNA-binding transcriptional regulator AlpA
MAAPSNREGKSQPGSLAVFIWRLAMTIRDTGPRQIQRQQSRADDYRVIRWKDWYESKGLSKWAANRLRKSGKGPRIVQLTEHAVGVTVKDDREWTESRIREGA